MRSHSYLIQHISLCYPSRSEPRVQHSRSVRLHAQRSMTTIRAAQMKIEVKIVRPRIQFSFDCVSILGELSVFEHFLLCLFLVFSKIDNFFLLFFVYLFVSASHSVVLHIDFKSTWYSRITWQLLCWHSVISVVYKNKNNKINAISFSLESPGKPWNL